MLFKLLGTHRHTSNMDKRHFGYILWVLAAIVTVASCVKITNFDVPSSYVIEDEENPGTLILDCAYESEPNEPGIVVKWWLNDTAIYQWIPKEAAPPRTFANPIRPFIDTNYTASDNEMQRHRALAIIKPMKNMTGEYSCQVGSYKNEDRRVQHLQMIVPETHFYLNVGKPFGNGGNNLSIECAAKNIFPEPKLTILPDTGRFVLSSKYNSSTGLFSTTIFNTMPTNQTDFVCLLSINGTDYQRSTNNSASGSSTMLTSVGNQSVFVPFTVLTFITGTYLFTAIFH